MTKSAQKLNIGRELLDTTWRMTIPVLLFAGIGIFMDIALHSKPWLTLLGAVIGFGFAAELVKRQIARSEDADRQSTADTAATTTTNSDDKGDKSL